jgi:pimeloyl-ACP methyl ester carboxylesterase
VPKLDVGGLTLHYRVAGAGPPLVLLHGIGSNARSWETIEPLLSRRFTVMAWDAPGYGESDDPALPFALGDYAVALRRLLDGLGIERIALLGHSFGGLIALEFCRRFPDRIGVLILADVALGGGAIDPKEAQQKYLQRLRDFETLPRQEFAEQRAPRLLSPGADPLVVARAVEIMAMVHDVGYRIAVEALHRADGRECLASIQVPTLILWGACDTITPLATSHFLQSRIPNARSVTFSTAGHLCYLECPESFAQAVEEFLASVKWEG